MSNVKNKRKPKPANKAKSSQVYCAGLGGPGSQMLGKEEEKQVLDVLQPHSWRDRFDNVRKFFKVRTFEDKLKEYVGTKHALGVSNATQGLVIAMHAAGVGPGDEVIVPAYTFIATAAAVVSVRAIPILAEVDETLGLDPKDVEKKITPYTKCILPVHMKGAPCRMSELMKIAKKHGLKVIEDVRKPAGAPTRASGWVPLATPAYSASTIGRLLRPAAAG